MTDYQGTNPSGLSDIGQPESGPSLSERILLLQRVRDGLLRKPAESSSDEEETAA